MESLFKYDYYQFKGGNSGWGGVIKALLKEPSLRYLYFQRKHDASKGIIRKICWCFSRSIGKKYGLELFTKNIGRYLYLGHPYGITVNANAILGNCVSLHKGCTIGQENRGKREGCPVLGNCVWIGINATIVGKISIGDDVLIAPNSYVNCDIPSHSVVIGNPCKIIPCEHATQKYFRYVNENNYLSIKDDENTYKWLK